MTGRPSFPSAMSAYVPWRADASDVVVADDVHSGSTYMFRHYNVNFPPPIAPGTRTSGATTATEITKKTTPAITPNAVFCANLSCRQ